MSSATSDRPLQRGTIVTFYSWTGGVGRTMALANTALQIVRQGLNVLVVDWDLEAPSLDRYFLSDSAAPNEVPSITKRPANHTGLLGLLCDAVERQNDEARRSDWADRLFHLSVNPALSNDAGKLGSLHLLPAGSRAADFGPRLNGFSWQRFFQEHNGGPWLERLRWQWASVYDFVLIDSRSGRTDGGGICTIQMPDIVVLVFTANEQSLDGGLKVVEAVQVARARFAYERSALAIVPLLSRWEGTTEVDLGQAWLAQMEEKLAPLTAAWLPARLSPRQVLERLNVRHVARFAFGEPLPVLTHSLTDPDFPGLAFDRLARLLVSHFGDAERIVDPDFLDDVEIAGRSADWHQFVQDQPLMDAEISRLQLSRGEASEDLRYFLGRVARGALSTGDLTLAESLWRRAVQVDLAALANDPRNRKRMEGLIQANFGLGDTCVAERDYIAAYAAYQSGLAFAKHLIEADPENVSPRRNSLIGNRRIGDIALSQGDLATAAMAYLTAIEIAQRLVAFDRSVLEDSRVLATLHADLGDVRHAKGDRAAALASYREGHRINGEVLAVTARETSKLSSAQKLSKEAIIDLRFQAELLGKISEVLERQGEWAEALHLRQQEMLPIYQRLGDDRACALVITQIADAFFAHDVHEHALTIYRRDLLPVLQRLGDERSRAATMDRIVHILESRDASLTGSHRYQGQVLNTADKPHIETDATRSLHFHSTRGDVISEICAQLDAFRSDDAQVIRGSTVISKDLSIDSLAVMDMIMELEDQFDVSIPMNVVAEIHTVDELADTILKLGARRSSPLLVKEQSSVQWRRR